MEEQQSGQQGKQRCPRSSKRRRTGRIPPIRVTPEEQAAIARNAEMCGLPPSTYLRNLGLGFHPKSVNDEKLLIELIHIHGTLGRLGGLLKMWLTNDERQIGAITTAQVPALVRDLEEMKGQLKSKLLELE